MTQPEAGTVNSNSTVPPAQAPAQSGASGVQGHNGDPGRLPLLPASEAEVDREALAALRGFFAGSAAAEPLTGDYLPALLWPFRLAAKVRTDYPLVLYPPAPDHEQSCAPLSEALVEAVARFAPAEDQARILRDNLPRLERIVRDRLAGAVAPVALRPAVTAAGETLQAELQLAGGNAEALQRDLDALEAALAEGQLLGFSGHADLYLLRHVVYWQLLPRRAAFHQEVARLASGLRGLLQVERSKADGARSVESLAANVGAGTDSFFDLAALSQQLGSHRGTTKMTAERRDRIDRALQVLESQGTADRPLLLVVHAVEVPAEFATGEVDDACARAAALFDAQAQVFAHVFRAMRVARLELDNAYDPARHDAWLDAFDWHGFSQQELLCLPVVAAVATDDQLAAGEMLGLSRLLVSGRPVQVIARVRPAANAGVGPGEDPLSGFRLELGYLGIGHREALVSQGSVARPAEVEPAFARALCCTRTALHVLFRVEPMTDGDSMRERLGSWLHAGAALESRAHPAFRYDPGAGESWAARFDIADNPALEADWPVLEQLFVKGGEQQQQTLSLAFTFADFALLEPAFARHFRVVPDSCAGAEELVPVDVFLGLGDDEAARCVPFVWGIDAQGRAQRLAISRALAIATRDRLSFWHNLQELAGVRNEHVDRAVAGARAAIAAEAAAELERIRAEHQAELERVRAETAAEAMARLAAVLTDLDVGSLGLAAPPAAAAARPAPPPDATLAADAPVEAAAPAAVAEDESFGFDEPMIDSMLCTSCNDCININPLLFVYNENKQAKIGDASKGTFAQLVQAAEKCPARCIHPGKPQNPNEPDLEALIKRAAPFN